MRNSRNKIIVLILGVLVSFIVLEMSLRVIGVVHSHRTRKNDTAKREPGAVAVLCLGDSFTEGYGALKGKGYPDQLEKLLQKKYPGTEIKIVNKGVSALNSAMILERFDEVVDEVDPDVIILLAGGANRWIAYGYGDYLNRNGLVNRLDNWLYEIKTFKLVRLFLFDFRSKRERLLEGYVSPAEEKMPPNAEEWRRKGEERELEGEYDEAISWYEKIVENYPLTPGGYDDLRKVYFKVGNKEGERRMLRKLIELDPKRLEFYVAYGARFLNAPDNDPRDIQFIQRYARENPMVEDILMKSAKRDKYHQEMKAWVKHDIEEMIRRAQRRGIKVILQTYPCYGKDDPYEGLWFINEGLRETAEKAPVLFIDNERLFDQTFLKGENKDDYFDSAKVHCNEKGYGMMAESIYCGLLAHDGLGILPPVDPEEKRKCSEL